MILALETSTPQASLAIWHHGELVWEKDFQSHRAHNAVLFGPLREALSRLDDASSPGETRPLRVVIGTGPGSYGGVRVGIAVGHALALARHGRAFGLPSIASLEANAALVGDARRNSYYVARIDNHALQGDPEVLDEDDFRQRLIELQKQGIPILTTDAEAPLGLQDVEVRTPNAADLARLAARLSDEEVEALSQPPLEPIYIRAPYITVAKPRFR